MRELKYEVTYWDYDRQREVSEYSTDSFFKALRTVHQLEKRYHCVSIRFRRYKVKDGEK